MSGGKGGRSNTEVTMPQFAETALQQGIGMAGDVSALGYTPYYGPDVAAFSPQQQAAFEGTNQMANAFGMPSASGQQYMPQATTMGGITGYSSGDGFDAAVGELANRRPGQAAYIDSFTIDPMTGEPGSRAGVNQPVALEMSGGRRGK
tara:strand:+ start:299 stop:742 length:444 start_codon:yes stop_codon:yes gene_type:complete